MRTQASPKVHGPSNKVEQAPFRQSAQKSLNTTKSTISPEPTKEAAPKTSQSSLTSVRTFFSRLAAFLWKCLTCGFSKESTDLQSDQKKHAKTEKKRSEDTDYYLGFCAGYDAHDRNKMPVEMVKASREILQLIKAKPELGQNYWELYHAIISTPSITDNRWVAFRVLQVGERGEFAGLINRMTTVLAASDFMEENHEIIRFAAFLANDRPDKAQAAYETLSDKAEQSILRVSSANPRNLIQTTQDVRELLNTEKGVNKLRKILAAFLRIHEKISIPSPFGKQETGIV